MVLPVSGFLPVPLPMMIPFMGAQSLVIGKMFGEGFQYGKRKISAMPNEEFNKLTFQDMMSNARQELKASIPSMAASMSDMDEMVEVIIDKFVGYLQKVIEKTPEALAAIGGSTAAAGIAGPAGIGLDIGLKTIKAGMTQAQFLAYTKILLAQQVADAQKPLALGLSDADKTEAERFREQQAFNIGFEKDKAALDRKRELQRAKDLRDVSGVTPIISRGFTRKRAAGQSQRLQKTRSIREIRRVDGILRVKKRANKDPVSIIQLTNRLKKERQRLADLLARYSF